MKGRVVVGALALLVILVVLAGLLFLRPGVETLPTTTLPHPAGRTVSMLPSDSLMDGFGFDGPVDEAALTAPENAALPTHVFEGRLELLGEQDGGRIQVLRGELGPEYAYLPEFDFEFVQSDSYLIPIRRGLIITDHPQWNLHLEPGRVWQEASDGEFSRASLPFALTVKGGNATFNGTLTFLFDERRISKVWYQVTQETTTYTRANLWGLLEAAYHPSPIAGAERIRADFAAELAARLPVKPIQELAEDYPGVDVSAFGRGVTPEHMTWYGVVVNGINYLGGCQTRSGIYPYCESMRATSYSTAKSTFPGVALLRLAQQYGPEVADLLITAYVPEYAASPGDWKQVTFNHVIDMTSGNYVSAGFMMDDNSEKMDEFFGAQPYAERIKAAFDCPHAAEPGTRWVYRTSDTFILTRALHNYLQTQAGPQADIFQFVVDEVYRPLGLGPGAYSTMRTADNNWQGQPEGGYGLWWTPDDIAKIATLLNNDGGAIGGVQVLQPDLLAAALQRDPDDRGVRIDSQRMYNNAFWATRYTQADGFDCEFWVPQMLGVSGNVVALMPNGVTYYYFGDNQEFTWDAALREADKIAPFCQTARSTLTPAFTESTQIVETTTPLPEPSTTPTSLPDNSSGGLIAFYSEGDGSPEIYTIHVDGSAETRLTFNPAVDLAPDISPNGAQIVFVSDRDGTEEIYRIDRGGSDQRQMLSCDRMAAFPKWSRDGRDDYGWPTCRVPGIAAGHPCLPTGQLGSAVCDAQCCGQSRGVAVRGCRVSSCAQCALPDPRTG